MGRFKRSNVNVASSNVVDPPVDVDVIKKQPVIDFKENGAFIRPPSDCQKKTSEGLADLVLCKYRCQEKCSVFLNLPKYKRGNRDEAV